MMTKATTTLKEVQEKNKELQEKTMAKIDALGKNSECLYDVLSSMQDTMDLIRGIPDDKRLQYQELEKTINEWKKQAEEISEEMKKSTGNTRPGMTNIEYGLSYLSLWPNIAAGLATSFETISIGLLLPTMGGIGSLGVSFALSLAVPFDPISALMAGLVWKYKAEEKRKAETIFLSLYSKTNKNFQKAISELNERIKRIVDETEKLKIGRKKVESFGTDYNSMSELQQYELGAYFNLMLSSTQLLIKPIDGLQPGYSAKDFDLAIIRIDESIVSHYETWEMSGGEAKAWTFGLSQTDKSYKLLCDSMDRKAYLVKNKDVLMYLCNVLDGVSLSFDDMEIISKCLKRNGAFLTNFKMSANDASPVLVASAYRLVNER